MASAQVQLPISVPSKDLHIKEATVKRNVQTALNFVKEQEDGSHLLPTYVGVPQSFYERPTEALPVTVHDVTGDEDRYTLDSHGFQFYTHQSREKDFLDDELIKREYYPETEQLLKDVTGASKVFIFDHTIRRGSEGSDRGPAKRVHIDQSYDAAPKRVSYHLPDEAPVLLQGRFQIINVWRPIKTILRDPLTVGDAHSLPDSDLIPIKLIYPDREGETFTVRPNKDIRWYYRFAQHPGLVTLIKCFDSETDGRARRVPHSAFDDAEMNGETPRESIEVRALVFHEK